MCYEHFYCIWFIPYVLLDSLYSLTYVFDDFWENSRTERPIRIWGYYSLQSKLSKYAAYRRSLFYWRPAKLLPGVHRDIDIHSVVPFRKKIIWSMWVEVTILCPEMGQWWDNDGSVCEVNLREHDMLNTGLMLDSCWTRIADNPTLKRHRVQPSLTQCWFKAGPASATLAQH